MLYELTLYGRYFGQQTVYDFNYVTDVIPAGVLGSFALVEAFGVATDGVSAFSGVFLAILDTAVSQWTAERIIARAPSDYDVTDFYEFVFNPPEAGNVTGGDAAPPFEAYGFVSNRVRTDIKPGSKRIAGVDDNLVNNGGVLNATALANVTALADAMSAQLEYDTGSGVVTFDNCIVSKERYPTTGGRFAYRYYETLAEQLEHIARGVSWTAKPNSTTQNSRKYGRGV